MKTRKALLKIWRERERENIWCKNSLKTNIKRIELGRVLGRQLLLCNFTSGYIWKLIKLLGFVWLLIISLIGRHILKIRQKWVWFRHNNTFKSIAYYVSSVTYSLTLSNTIFTNSINHQYQTKIISMLIIKGFNY